MPILTIIDMQVGMTWPEVGVRNNPQAEFVIAGASRYLACKRCSGGARAPSLAITGIAILAGSVRRGVSTLSGSAFDRARSRARAML